MINKISFEDKETSLNLNSVFIVSANDANEIKLVVNNLIDFVNSRAVSIDKAYKYLKFGVPTNLNENESYNIIIESAEDANFSRDIHSISINSISDKFKIFENDVFVDLNRRITKNDAGHAIVADISSILSENRKYYRFHFESMHSSTEYKAFAIGLNDYVDEYDEKPVSIILNRNIESINVNDIDKAALLKISQSKLNIGFSDVTAIKAYLKYDRIPNNVRSYLSNNNEISINGNIIDVTSLVLNNIRYTVKDINDELKETTVSNTVFTDVGQAVKFSRTFISTKNYQKDDMMLNVNVMNNRLDLTFERDLYGDQDSEQHTGDVNVSAGPNLSINSNVLSSTFADASFDSYVEYDHKKAPIHVINNDIMDIASSIDDGMNLMVIAKYADTIEQLEKLKLQIHQTMVITLLSFHIKVSFHMQM